MRRDSVNVRPKKVNCRRLIGRISRSTHLSRIESAAVVLMLAALHTRRERSQVSTEAGYVSCQHWSRTVLEVCNSVEAHANIVMVDFAA
jgi:single-stranded DNA-binding protein